MQVPRSGTRSEPQASGALGMDEVRLPARERSALLVQLAVSRLLSPLWIPVTSLLMRFAFGWRVSTM